MRFQGEVFFDTKVNHCRLKLNNSQHFNYYLARFKGPVVVQVETRRKVRSYKSNRRYWGAVIGTALDEAESFTGHTKDELHEIFKRRYLKPRLVKFKGEEYPIWSTRNLTDGEFVEYCLKIETDLAEMGIRIPTPDEFYKGI